MTVIVHCFRCDEVVDADTDADGPLWCSRCDDDEDIEVHLDEDDPADSWVRFKD